MPSLTPAVTMCRIISEQVVTPETTPQTAAVHLGLTQCSYRLETNELSFL